MERHKLKIISNDFIKTEYQKKKQSIIKVEKAFSKISQGQKSLRVYEK